MLHPSSSKLTDHQHCQEVNAALLSTSNPTGPGGAAASCWQIRLFQEYQSSLEHYLKAGDVIRMFHGVTNNNPP